MRQQRSALIQSAPRACERRQRGSALVWGFAFASVGLAALLGCQPVPAQQPDAQPTTVTTPSVAASVTAAPAAEPRDAAPAPAPEDPEPAPSGAAVQCPPRRADAGPIMCTREYRPVCGVVDTGVRCVTTPCPSVQFKTFGNGCTACADPKTISYRPGACGADDAKR